MTESRWILIICLEPKYITHYSRLLMSVKKTPAKTECNEFKHH